MKQWLYILSVVLFVACNKVVEKPPVVIRTQPIKQNQVDPAVLQGNKSHIDSLFKYAVEKEITIYVKQKGIDSLIKVEAKHLPQDIENTINIFRDNMGHIIRISESPSSESGDLFICFNHYFDDRGKTFAFEKKTNSFNNHCTDGVAYETQTFYYDENFKQVSHTYKLVDENDMPLAKDSCDIIEFEYTTQPDVINYLKLQGLPH
jgi:hypothetical protein